MKRIVHYFIPVLVMFSSSCGSEDPAEKTEAKKADQKEQLIGQIQKLEGEMHRSLQIDNVLAGQAIQAYDDYASLYPADSIVPDYLFKAAEITTAIKQYPQALTYYETIIEKYPEFKLVQESYFLEASLYDHYLNDDIKAEDTYERLLSKFPSGSYAADAKAAISNLGKSDQELHEEFKKKNGEK